MHVQRTADSAAAMLQGVPNADAILAQVGSAESLRPRLDATVGSAVRAYLASNGGDEATELKVTVLVTWTAADAAEGSGCDAASTSSVSCHVAPLPPIPSPPVRVEVRGAPRQNAAAKDSTWVTDRAPLEELMRRGWAPFNELLLVSDAGELLEGSQTNFFAVQDGQLVTASEGILEGTVRRLLLEVCEREGIPVVLQPPKLADASKWEGALISSTSRLMLPIDELYLPREGEASLQADRIAAFDNGPGSLAARLKAMVQAEVEAHSTEIR